MTDTTSGQSGAGSLPPLAPNPELWESLGGATLIELNGDRQEIAIQFECLSRFCHTNGSIAQGGFVTAWMDAAMAHAVMLCSKRQFSIASLDINVRFMRAVGPGTVIARGRIVRMGKRIAFLEATLEDSKQQCVATATSSGMLVPLRADHSE